MTPLNESTKQTFVITCLEDFYISLKDFKGSPKKLYLILPQGATLLRGGKYIFISLIPRREF